MHNGRTIEFDPNPAYWAKITQISQKVGARSWDKEGKRNGRELLNPKVVFEEYPDQVHQSWNIGFVWAGLNFAGDHWDVVEAGQWIGAGTWEL